jgi:hypothetical protein
VDWGVVVPTLDWMTRSADVTAHAPVPYRMFQAVPALDGGDGDPANMLIQGDSLDALKALLQFYAGREFRCAVALDSHPMVKHWVRNIVRGNNACWLPTSTDRFYPDFIAELTDGRMLVLEYKGRALSRERGHGGKGEHRRQAR